MLPHRTFYSALFCFLIVNSDMCSSKTPKERTVAFPLKPQLRKRPQRYVILILHTLLRTSTASSAITVQWVDGNSQQCYFTCYNGFSPRVISYSVNNLNPKGWSYFISRQNQITGIKSLLLNL